MDEVKPRRLKRRSERRFKNEFGRDITVRVERPKPIFPHETKHDVVLHIASHNARSTSSSNNTITRMEARQLLECLLDVVGQPGEK